uniref:Putative radical SAM superfamily protein n=1 Tax=viral metagenome TaxID=1070528 RepID=A0A6M3JRX8_9ZZZZ
MTATRKAGYNFDLYDMDINNYSILDLKEYLRNNHYSIYAFGCIITGYKKVKEIAQVIRDENSFAVIVAGNSVASSIPELLLKNTEVNYAVIGEGEETWIEFLKHIKHPWPALHGMNGLALHNSRGVVPRGWVNPFKRKPIDNMDSIGFPDWDLFDLKKYNEYGRDNVNTFDDRQITSFPLNTARGCPFDCHFCYHVFKGMKYRRYSIDKVIEEIDNLYLLYGCNYVCFWDELTFPNSLSAREFIKEFSKSTSVGDIKWDAVIRGDIFSKKDFSLLKDMKDLGCVGLAYSLESADEKILNYMNKKLDLNKFKEQTEIIYKAGLIPRTSVIFGFPQETIHTINKTIQMCRELNLFPSAGFLLPLPGTPIYDWCIDKGLIKNEVEHLERIGDRQDLHINLTGMEDSEMTDLVRSGLESLAKDQGIEVGDVFKTGTYKKPKDK